MLLNSTQVNNAYLGSTNVSAIYLGETLVWPLSRAALWTNFNPNSCITLGINSTMSIPNGISWGDGSFSQIFTGNNEYYNNSCGQGYTPNPNYFTYPFNVDTLLYPATAGLSGPNWSRGGSATRVGTTAAPDGSQNAVIYRSSQVPDCFVSQGYLANWKPNTTYTFSIWARLINDGGQPNNLGTLLNITRNSATDRVWLSANGLINNTWKKFSLSFTTGPTNSNPTFYTTCFLFEGWQANQEVALWGAGMTY